jgi:hypothetical protein
VFATFGGVSIHTVDDSETIQEAAHKAGGQRACSGTVRRLETIRGRIPSKAHQVFSAETVSRLVL